VLGHSGARLVFCEDAPQAAKIAVIRDRCRELEQIVMIDDGELPGTMPLSELRRRGESVEATVVDDRLSASDVMMAHPLALQLRNLQTLVEISVDKNSTVIFPAPLMSTIQELGTFLKNETQAAGDLPAVPTAMPAPPSNGELIPHDRPQPPIEDPMPNDPNTPTPAEPVEHHSTFAEGESDPKRYPEEEHVGTFAEGDSDPERYPGEDHVGEFSDVETAS
jgi:hypothetical protein